MKIFNSITTPIFNELMIRQLMIVRGKGFFKRLFYKKYIKKYASMITAYKE